MELTKSDCEDIEMLVNISFSLLSSINKLCQLEIDGNKDSKEFKNILESAKRELALEESIFERLVSNPNKCVDAINYLRSMSIFKDSIYNSNPIGFLCNIIDSSDCDLVLEHLLNKFILNKLENNALGSEEMAEESEFLKQISKYTNYLTSFLGVDSSNLYLTLIENTTFIAIGDEKNKLIKSKYDNLFISCKSLEDFLANGCNNVLKPIMLHHNARIVCQISIEMESKIKRIILLNTLEEHFEKFKLFLKYDTLNENSIHAVYLLELLIRATIILIEDEESRQIIKEKIMEYSKKLENNLDNEKYLFIYNILNEILSSMEDDRSIPQYVSFGRM